MEDKIRSFRTNPSTPRILMPLRKPTSLPNLKPRRSKEECKNNPFENMNFSFCLAAEEYLAHARLSSGGAVNSTNTCCLNKNEKAVEAELKREDCSDFRTGNCTQSSSFTENISLESNFEFDNKENHKNSSEDLSLFNHMMQLNGSPSPAVSICSNCGLTGMLRCSGCKQVNYCSVSCQRKDWGIHKLVCKENSQKQMHSEKMQDTLRRSEENIKAPEPKENVQSKRTAVEDLPKMEIIEGVQLKALVIEFVTPDKFFVHIESSQTKQNLNKISLTLQNTCLNIESNGDYVPKKGEVCAAIYSHDKNWYRGLVQSIDLNLSSANIFYIDFGNEEEVTLGEIKALPIELATVPPCAMQCRLANVAAVGGTWSEECCISMKKLLLGNSCHMTVTALLHGGTILLVDIIPPNSEKPLEKILLEQSYAVTEKKRNRLDVQDINTLLNMALEKFKTDEKHKESNHTCPGIIEVSVGESFLAVITHVKSPDDFVLQKLNNTQLIEELHTRLREYCMQSPASKVFHPSPSSFCCSRFTEDNLWYRAAVLGYTTDGKIHVGYVDFGNSEEVSIDRLCPIDSKFLELPFQAISCALAGIKPLSDAWIPAANQLVKNIVGNKFLNVTVIGRKGRKALVELMDEYSDPQINIAEQLILVGYGVADNMDTFQTPFQEDSKERNGKVSLIGKTEWSTSALPQNQAVDVILSVVNSPGDFYCQYINVEDLCALSKLCSELQRNSKSQGNAFTPAIGDPCCAIFPGDNNIYRALVKDVTMNGKVKIYFVDYGNISEVAIGDVFPILSKHLKLPFQAIKCWLSGIKPLHVDWTNEAIDRFKTLTIGIKPQVTVVSVNEHGFGVEMKWKDKSIADILVMENLAALENTQEAVQFRDTGCSFWDHWKTIGLPVNETSQLFVVEVINPSLFYAQKDSEKVDEQKLQVLLAELEEYCCTQSPKAEFNPKIETACCARLSDDGKWYRAIVLDTNENEAKVVYADFGIIKNVPFSWILPIKEKHLELPFQCLRCTLADIEECPTSVLEKFYELVYKKNITATVLSFDGKTHTLSMSVPTDHGPVDVIKMLMNGLVECKNETISPVNSFTKERDTSCSTSGTPPNCQIKCCCDKLMEKINRVEVCLHLILEKLENLKD
ncbi:tudor domain-containing protein 1 [Erpetoichthys calabaricus]|uniref:tudor domain-containing protein 1 n=1 Tax=Erpetoichthys calabaricus TaxID=27687 RepID=UPI0022349204|nr:tudor domain-containing protein 1 [Erpetoichthys calabaricus]